MSDATRIIAIRHGETAWNAAARLQGQLDIPLNAVGRAQAAQLAAALGDEGIAAVICSDLGRAAETARALAEPLGLPLQLDAALRERGFGTMEGRSFEEIDRDWPELARRWRSRDPDFAPPGGERLADFYARSVAAAERLALAHAGRTIALVTHGGVLDCLYRAAARIELQASRTWQLGNAAINRLLHSPEGFVLVGWNDHQHLLGLGRDEPRA
ncbi:histidine phosphatase family protein [Aquabacterium sp.]|uniref:histidine phosphatase family protein n=1 Tax=Aquabacterium sp. TaxID=1872578 RepID=UPI002B8636A7|nr:histidine phosphatase family protein [Aquabacterium sp.]HSW07804.1 histidine phosphatase family protein [Aquabacterium sp.]